MRSSHLRCAQHWCARHPEGLQMMRRSSPLPKPPGVERPLNSYRQFEIWNSRESPHKPRFRKTMSAEFLIYPSEIDSVGVRTQNLSLWCEKNGMMSVRVLMMHTIRTRTLNVNTECTRRQGKLERVRIRACM